jgi:hypothetical protein
MLSSSQESDYYFDSDEFEEDYFDDFYPVANNEFSEDDDDELWENPYEDDIYPHREPPFRNNFPKKIKKSRDVNVFLDLINCKKPTIINMLPNEITKKIYEYIKYNENRPLSSNYFRKCSSERDKLDVELRTNQEINEKIGLLDELIPKNKLKYFDKLTMEINIKIRNLVANYYKIKNIKISNYLFPKNKGNVPNNWEELD